MPLTALCYRLTALTPSLLFFLVNNDLCGYFWPNANAPIPGKLRPNFRPGTQFIKSASLIECSEKTKTILFTEGFVFHIWNMGVRSLSGLKSYKDLLREKPTWGMIFICFPVFSTWNPGSLWSGCRVDSDMWVRKKNMYFW